MANCNTSNQPFNTRIVVTTPTSETGGASSEIEIVGVAPIKVLKQVISATKTRYTISYSPSVSPTCSVTVTPSFAEIGVSQTFTFVYRDQMGSSPILTRLQTPNDSPLTTTFTQPGTQGIHYYSVTDTEGQSCSSNVGINVLYRFFRGTVARGGSLVLADVQAMNSALGSSIGGAFPRSSYVMDKPQGNFVFVYPADFNTIPTPTGDGNFPFELTPIAGTFLINGITYKAAQTVTSFVNGGTATLGF